MGKRIEEVKARTGEEARADSKGKVNVGIAFSLYLPDDNQSGYWNNMISTRYINILNLSDCPRQLLLDAH